MQSVLSTAMYVWMGIQLKLCQSGWIENSAICTDHWKLERLCMRKCASNPSFMICFVLQFYYHWKVDWSCMEICSSLPQCTLPCWRITNEVNWKCSSNNNFSNPFYTMNGIYSFFFKFSYAIQCWNISKENLNVLVSIEYTFREKYNFLTTPPWGWQVGIP